MTQTVTQAPSTGFSEILSENKNAISKIKNFEAQPITTKARNLAFAGLTVGSVAFIGLFAAQIISGIAALIATFAFAGSMFFGIRFLRAMDPVIRQKTKNLVLNSMYSEARKNAVAQLDNQVITNAARLKNARHARDKMGALVQKLESAVSSTDPSNSYYKQKKDMLDRVEKAYIMFKTNTDKAAKANQVFETKVKEYKDMERFAQIAGEALSLFDKSGNKLEDMLSLAAFEQIEEDFNSAIISIENTANDMALDSDVEFA